MITRKMVREGYDTGIIKLIHTSEVVCQIGDIWFFFGGLTAEEYESADAYKADIPKEDILNDIFTTLEAFRVDGERGEEAFADEYLYYELILKEQLGYQKAS